MLEPVRGCRVVHHLNPREVGVVTAATRNGEATSVQVTWPGGRSSTADLTQLRTALAPMVEVEHVPSRPDQASFGVGRVEQLRTVAGSDQVLVDFWESNARHWLPWQRLRAVPGVRDQFVHRMPTQAGDAEAFRMRNLAWALDQWHKNTGALSRLEIDPLPHQIHLVHRILTSGNLNWLIADDVGLGKTIEVGLLLAALLRRGLKRFLFVVPAGLTRQWKEEMRDKFDVPDFMIYGEDFTIDSGEQWKLFDKVIASVDRLKLESHKKLLALAERWDLVVFDEAHWLSRAEVGLKTTSSDRYRLAQQVRRHTDSMLLLTGTPHQGRDDKFRALLELLRPGAEWRRRFIRITDHPEILRDMIIRNRKADVTDAEGNFIFKGKETHTVSIELKDEEREFDRQLQHYLSAGYEASGRGGTGAILVGFVMTVYRKLAASSTAAISRALKRRLLRLSGEEDSGEPPRHLGDPDDRFVEDEELQADVRASRTEFFTGEVARIHELLKAAERLEGQDSKLEFLIDSLIPSILANNEDEKLLLFTEYRTTQNMLRRALEEKYGAEAVNTIHGGQTLAERRAAIDAFEEGGQFMLSTEAGGEGLNLQRKCHILINYDLPWNPMRLVQRVGRLYRYGQEKRVLVFNFHVPDTMDSRILQRMYDRLDRVAAEMAAVSSEYQEGLHDDILGGLVGQLDIETINQLLAEAGSSGVDRTEERLEEALARARDALERQEEILSGVSRYDAGALAHELKLDVAHLKAFAEGMCWRLGIEVSGRLYEGAVWELSFPESLSRPEQIRARARIAFDRHVARRARGAELFAPEQPVYEFFVSRAKAFSARGQTAAVNDLPGRTGLGAMIRWMDTLGRPLYQEYVGVLLGADGRPSVNSAEWAQLLLEPMSDQACRPGEGTLATWGALERAVEEELKRRMDRELLPDSPWPLGLLWAERTGGTGTLLDERKSPHQPRTSLQAAARSIETG